MYIAISLHLLAAVVWIGGMFFAWMCLRPVAATVLQPAERLPLWLNTLKNFFLWVWLAVILLPTTGTWMMMQLYPGMKGVPMFINLMMGIGMLMILIFVHVFFAPYRRMRLALQAGDLPEAGRRLGQIRLLVGVNLILGVLVTVIASGGRYF
jgi:uncharacterized membrane protein